MWTKGRITIEGTEYTYCIKHFEEGSIYGINEGRISKLNIKAGDRDVVNYDRGWDVKPADKEAQKALDTLLKKYN